MADVGGLAFRHIYDHAPLCCERGAAHEAGPFFDLGCGHTYCQNCALIVGEECPTCRWVPHATLQACYSKYAPVMERVATRGWVATGRPENDLFNSCGLYLGASLAVRMAAGMLSPGNTLTEATSHAAIKAAFVDVASGTLSDQSVKAIVADLHPELQIAEAQDYATDAAAAVGAFEDSVAMWRRDSEASQRRRVAQDRPARCLDGSMSFLSLPPALDEGGDTSEPPMCVVLSKHFIHLTVCFDARSGGSVLFDPYGVGRRRLPYVASFHTDDELWEHLATRLRNGAPPDFAQAPPDATLRAYVLAPRTPPPPPANLSTAAVVPRPTPVPTGHGHLPPPVCPASAATATPSTEASGEPACRSAPEAQDDAARVPAEGPPVAVAPPVTEWVLPAPVFVDAAPAAVPHRRVLSPPVSTDVFRSASETNVVCPDSYAATQHDASPPAPYAASRGYTRTPGSTAGLSVGGPTATHPFDGAAPSVAGSELSGVPLASTHSTAYEPSLQSSAPTFDQTFPAHASASTLPSTAMDVVQRYRAASASAATSTVGGASPLSAAPTFNQVFPADVSTTEPQVPLRQRTVSACTATTSAPSPQSSAPTFNQTFPGVGNAALPSPSADPPSPLRVRDVASLPSAPASLRWCAATFGQVFTQKDGTPHQVFGTSAPSLAEMQKVLKVQDEGAAVALAAGKGDEEDAGAVEMVLPPQVFQPTSAAGGVAASGTQEGSAPHMSTVPAAQLLAHWSDARGTHEVVPVVPREVPETQEEEALPSTVPAAQAFCLPSPSEAAAVVKASEPEPHQEAPDVEEEVRCVPSLPATQVVDLPSVAVTTDRVAVAPCGASEWTQECAAGALSSSACSAVFTCETLPLLLRDSSLRSSATSIIVQCRCATPSQLSRVTRPSTATAETQTSPPRGTPLAESQPSVVTATSWAEADAPWATPSHSPTRSNDAASTSSKVGVASWTQSLRAPPPSAHGSAAPQDEPVAEEGAPACTTAVSASQLHRAVPSTPGTSPPANSLPTVRSVASMPTEPAAAAPSHLHGEAVHGFLVARSVVQGMLEDEEAAARAALWKARAVVPLRRAPSLPTPLARAPSTPRQTTELPAPRVPSPPPAAGVTAEAVAALQAALAPRHRAVAAEEADARAALVEWQRCAVGSLRCREYLKSTSSSPSIASTPCRISPAYSAPPAATRSSNSPPGVASAAAVTTPYSLLCMQGRSASSVASKTPGSAALLAACPEAEAPTRSSTASCSVTTAPGGYSDPEAEEDEEAFSRPSILSPQRQPDLRSPVAQLRVAASAAPPRARGSGFDALLSPRKHHSAAATTAPRAAKGNAAHSFYADLTSPPARRVSACDTPPVSAIRGGARPASACSSVASLAERLDLSMVSDQARASMVSDQARASMVSDQAQARAEHAAEVSGAEASDRHILSGSEERARKTLAEYEAIKRNLAATRSRCVPPTVAPPDAPRSSVFRTL